MDSGRVNDVLRRARNLVKESKTIDKLVYQLAFIYVRMGPRADEAWMILKEMRSLGLISEEYLRKVLDDVRRWRAIRYRDSDIEYGETR